MHRDLVGVREDVLLHRAAARDRCLGPAAAGPRAPLGPSRHQREVATRERPQGADGRLVRARFQALGLAEPVNRIPL